MIVAIAVILWILISLLVSFEFGAVLKFTSFERRRRAAQGDTSAADEEAAIARRAAYEGFRAVAVMLLSVCLVVLLISQYGPLWGGFAAISLFALTQLLQRVVVFQFWSGVVQARLAPLIDSIVSQAGFVFRLFGRSELTFNEPALQSKEELLHAVELAKGVFSKDETDRLRASLKFDHTLISDVMTPRSMIDFVSVSEAVGPMLMDDMHKTGHSRFPVVDGDIDHVVGVLYLKDVLDFRAGKRSVREAMRKDVYYVHAKKDLTHALAAFLRTKHHLFVVVNEYRETVGLLSLEDVLEALLGKRIVDEFDEFDDLRAVAAGNPHGNNAHGSAKDI